MIQHILTQTPVYVWAILGFLLYRGVAASQERVVSYRSVFIVPGIMLVLGVDSTARGFGLETPAGAAWAVGLLAGAALAWKLAARASVDRAAGTVRQPGSWLPLALMMAVFCCKYATGVALAIQPALRSELHFAVPMCLAVGLLNGAFAGRLLRTVATWHSVPAAVPAA
jgi:hypothetical protein